MLIISSCSSTKRSPIDPRLTAWAVRTKRIDPFAREWVKRVSTAPAAARAADLYGGPGVAAALAAAKRLSCPAYFVSAGMSLVPASRRLPSYDLSVSHPASCPPAVATGGATAADWWRALNAALGREAPIASLVRRSKEAVLIALPEAYVRMVSDDLMSLSPLQQGKLRLIVAKNTRLPKDLEHCAIRYDDRLAGLADAPRGANAYFAQRALGHFAGLLVRHRMRSADIATHRDWVQADLSKAEQVMSTKRAQQSDADATRWIQAADRVQIRSVSALLKRFREDGLACEQKRFRNLVELSRKTKV